MSLSFTGKKRVRKLFGHMVEVAQMPNLIEVQKTSYDQFLQVEKPAGGRLDQGLSFPSKTTSRLPPGGRLVVLYPSDLLSSPSA